MQQIPQGEQQMVSAALLLHLQPSTQAAAADIAVVSDKQLHRVALDCLWAIGNDGAESTPRKHIQQHLPWHEPHACSVKMCADLKELECKLEDQWCLGLLRLLCRADGEPRSGHSSPGQQKAAACREACECWEEYVQALAHSSQVGCGRMEIGSQ